MEDFKENYLMWVVLVGVGLLVLNAFFVKKDAAGAISFGMPKLTKKETAKAA